MLRESEVISYWQERAEKLGETAVGYGDQSLDKQEDKHLFYIVKLPNIPDTYTFITDISYLVNGIWYEGESITKDIVLENSIEQEKSDIIDVLIELRDSATKPSDENQIDNAIKRIEKLDFTVETQDEIERQIEECIKAIDHLLQVESVDTSEARIEIIKLLLFFEMKS